MLNSILKRSQLEASVTESSLPRGQLAKQFRGKHKESLKEGLQITSPPELCVWTSQGAQEEQHKKSPAKRSAGPSIVLSASHTNRNQPCCYGLIASIIYHFFSRSLGFPGGSAGKESACIMGDLGSIPGWEDPLEKGKATHSSILAWRIPWTI